MNFKDQQKVENLEKQVAALTSRLKLATGELLDFRMDERRALAGMAMKGLLAAGSGDELTRPTIALRSVEYADAVIVELDKMPVKK